MANGCRHAVFIPFRFLFLPPNLLRAFYPRVQPGHPSTNPRSFPLYLSPSRRPRLLFPLCSSPLFASTCVLSLSSQSFPWSPPLAPNRSSLPAIVVDGPQGDATTSLGRGLAPIRPPSPWSSSIRCALLPYPPFFSHQGLILRRSRTSPSCHPARKS